MLNDYKLDPPNNPDQDDPCDECGKAIGEECFEVQLPGRWHHAINVCSPECQTQYLIGYAAYVMDGRSDWD